MYGKELIVDLHNCKQFPDIETFCQKLAKLVDMQVEDFHLWASEPDDEKDPKTWGVSAIQFILTSNITVHTLPLYKGGSVYVNLFSCKDFDAITAVLFIADWFDSKNWRHQVVERN